LAKAGVPGPRGMSGDFLTDSCAGTSGNLAGYDSRMKRLSHNTNYF